MRNISGAILTGANVSRIQPARPLSSLTGLTGTFFGGAVPLPSEPKLSVPVRSLPAAPGGSAGLDLGLRTDWLGLSALLCVSLFVAFVSVRLSTYRHYWLDQYMGPAMEMVRTGHIQYDFLPVLYPALLAEGYKLFGSEEGVTAVNIALSLLMLASCWMFLRLSGLRPALTLVVVSALSLYPDFALSYDKTQDTSITALAIFAFLSALIFLIKEKNRPWLPDILAGATLGFAVLVRTNMMTLGLASIFVLHRLGAGRLLRRALLQASAASAIYCLATLLIHGSVFFPRNGSYNLFAGYNQFTSAHLWNEEDSIGDACNADHLACANDRDPRLDHFYRTAAINFIRQNPGQAGKLFFLKFGYMMSPDLHLHPFDTLAGKAKVLESFGIPLWVIASFFFWNGRRSCDTRLLITSVLVAVITPFCLIISTHRFRVPLDFLCWSDLGATALLALGEWRKKKALHPSGEPSPGPSTVDQEGSSFAD